MTRLTKNILILIIGILLQLVFWRTRVLLIGILAYTGLIYGFGMIPDTVVQYKRKRDTKKDGTSDTDVRFRKAD